MKLTLVLLLALAACKPATHATSHLDYEFNKQTRELKVRVKVPEGMHAYAPGELIGRPVELVIEPMNHWNLDGTPTIPTGNSKHLLSGTFEIKAKLKNGQGPIHGILKMQLCSDNSCERPKDYAFKVAL